MKASSVKKLGTRRCRFPTDSCNANFRRKNMNFQNFNSAVKEWFSVLGKNKNFSTCIDAIGRSWLDQISEKKTAGAKSLIP